MAQINKNRNKLGNKSPKLLTKKEIEKKNLELSLSLKDAEARQLSDYLKNRTVSVDNEINQTRNRLNLQTTNNNFGETFYNQNENELKSLLRKLKQSKFCFCLLFCLLFAVWFTDGCFCLTCLIVRRYGRF